MNINCILGKKHSLINTTIKLDGIHDTEPETIANAFNSFIIIIIKKGLHQCKVRESDLHPISPKTPAPGYQPIDRKKRNGKRVEDYSRYRAA